MVGCVLARKWQAVGGDHRDASKLRHWSRTNSRVQHKLVRCRVPIISSGCGAAEIVTDAINGFIFEAGKEKALAEVMRQVVADAELVDRVGAAGRLTLPKFTAFHVNPSIRQLLDEAVEGYRRA